MRWLLSLLVYCADPTITVTISDASGNHGDMVTLTCSVSGIDLTGATYSFYKGDTLLAGPDTDSHSLPAVLANAGGDYYCEVTVSPQYLDVSGPLTVRSSNNGSLSVTSECVWMGFGIRC